MAQYKRNPVPKTQKEVSKGLRDAFDTTRGSSDQFANRGAKLSAKNDTSKPFSIGIQDLDEAIFYYMENIIKPSVYQNGERRTVPFIYAAPERWKSYQKDGYYRDKGGSIMLPIIIIKRNNIEKDRTVYNKLDANMPNMYGSFGTQYNPKNAYGNFNVLNNRKPVKHYNLTVVPDFVTLTYSCVIQTYYMEQLNKLIEQIEYASDSYWGDPERFKFRSFIDSFSTQTELTAGKDRLVKSQFDIRLRGYIVPSVIQKDLNSAKKINSKAKVTITSETVTNINDI